VRIFFSFVLDAREGKEAVLHNATRVQISKAYNEPLPVITAHRPRSGLAIIAVAGARTWRETNQMSFFGRPEPAEAHHVHHVLAAVAVDLHRGRTIPDELETCPVSRSAFFAAFFSARAASSLSRISARRLSKSNAFAWEASLVCARRAAILARTLLEGGPF